MILSLSDIISYGRTLAVYDDTVVNAMAEAFNRASTEDVFKAIQSMSKNALSGKDRAAYLHELNRQLAQRPPFLRAMARLVEWDKQERESAPASAPTPASREDLAPLPYRCNVPMCGDSGLCDECRRRGAR